LNYQNQPRILTFPSNLPNWSIRKRWKNRTDFSHFDLIEDSIRKNSSHRVMYRHFILICKWIRGMLFSHKKNLKNGWKTLEISTRFPEKLDIPGFKLSWPRVICKKITDFPVFQGISSLLHFCEIQIQGQLGPFWGMEEYELRLQSSMQSKFFSKTPGFTKNPEFWKKNLKNLVDFFN